MENVLCASSLVRLLWPAVGKPDSCCERHWTLYAKRSHRLATRLRVRALIPESPRWLAVHAKYDEVTDLLAKMCRINHRELPADFDARCLVDECDKVNTRWSISLRISVSLRSRWRSIDITYSLGHRMLVSSRLYVISAAATNASEIIIVQAWILLACLLACLGYYIHSL